MPTDKAQPIPLPPNAWPNTNLRIQLHTHLEIAFQLRHRNGIAMTHGASTLEATDHGVQIALLGGLYGGGLGRRTINGFVKDWIVWVVLFHGGEVVGAFKKVLALARGVFGADRLAVDALC